MSPELFCLEKSGRSDYDQPMLLATVESIESEKVNRAYLKLESRVLEETLVAPKAKGNFSL